jgi:hypothetical protein
MIVLPRLPNARLDASRIPPHDEVRALLGLLCSNVRGPNGERFEQKHACSLLGVSIYTIRAWQTVPKDIQPSRKGRRIGNGRVPPYASLFLLRLLAANTTEVAKEVWG